MHRSIDHEIETRQAKDKPSWAAIAIAFALGFIVFKAMLGAV
jgi:hypothetical protein